MHEAVERWPSPMSATGFPRVSIATKKSFICARVAGAACSSMWASVTSSGKLFPLVDTVLVNRLALPGGDEVVAHDVGFERAFVAVESEGPGILWVGGGAPAAVLPDDAEIGVFKTLPFVCR